MQRVLLSKEGEEGRTRTTMIVMTPGSSCDGHNRPKGGEKGAEVMGLAAPFDEQEAKKRRRDGIPK